MKLFRPFFALTILPALLAAAVPDRMAPLSSYLMGRNAEIALARSAAPPSISNHATVLVLTPHGYVVAVQGDNGFTCYVDRAWTQPFDDRHFWNPRLRGPMCLNPQATRTILPYAFKRTAWALSGATKAEIMARMKASVAARALPTPEPGSMSYMMSKHQYLNDDAKAWYPHVMLYEPKADGAKGGKDWGANRLCSPVVYDSFHHINPEPWSIFYVPVAHWSDGSPAPVYTGT